MTKRGNTKHGMKHHPIYKVWKNMKQRCQNPNNGRYSYYGGRGIKVCERWQDFIPFMEDMLPTWKPGLSIDRINNDGNYEPFNCRWATRSVQNSNQRLFGEIPFKGVCRSPNGKNYKAQINVNNKKIGLGTFSTPEEAAEAYQQAKERAIHE
jgi:hypothetical protein